MKANNLKKSILFFLMYMVSILIMDRLIPGNKMVLKTKLVIGLMISTAYLLILSKATSEKN